MLLFNVAQPQRAHATLSEEAAADLDRLLRLTGEPSLNQISFQSILKSMGLKDVVAKEKGELMFARLVDMCREAEEIAACASNDYVPSERLKAGGIDGNALRCLYMHHPSYTKCINSSDTALALTEEIKDYFEEATAPSTPPASSGSKGSLVMDKEATARMLRRLSASTTSTSAMTESSVLSASSRREKEEEEETNSPAIAQAVEELMSSHRSLYEDDMPEEVSVNTRTSTSTDSISSLADAEEKPEESAPGLTLEMVASSLLRYHDASKSAMPKNLKSLFQGNLAPHLFDPFHATAKDFVAALDEVVLKHDAVNHHLLTSFSMGSFGGLLGTLTCLADFMDAYRFFTRTFCTHLAHTITLVRAEDTPEGHYVEVLEENEEEENGNYDDDAREMIHKLGLTFSTLDKVQHRDLYVMCCGNLRRLISKLARQPHGGEKEIPVPLTEEQCAYIAAPLVSAFEAACNPDKGATAATAIAAMYSGSELIVATLYSKLCSFIRDQVQRESNPITRDDLAFFILHIDMDVEHADHMKEVVVALAKDEKNRLHMASAVDNILQARVTFYDRFVEAVFPPTGHGGVGNANLYNKQSQNWVRKGATCLSDFTGRPVVFDMCSPHVKGAHVLDVGCGEGYVARKVVGMGATRVVGLDVSQGMIERANSNPAKSSREIYETCDATKIIDKLGELPATFGIAPSMLETGCFDLAMAVFLFNYTTISQMQTICSQVYQALKPGGHFVFSVPHPFMLNAHGEALDENGNPTTFSFAKGDIKPDSYFSLRDRKFAGVIRTLDGRDLNVKMLFKSVSDYIETMDSVGFNIEKMHEARVLPEHVAAHPEFFESVKDSPLHIVFDVVKPEAVAQVDRIPKAIAWTSYEKAESDKMVTLAMPSEVSDELCRFAIDAHKSGATESTFAPTGEDLKNLSNVAAFAATLRVRLQHLTGAAHVVGLDMKQLCKDVDSVTSAERAKLAYYILSSLIGRVDGSARGRLFDVVDKGFDTNADNVLFSVSKAAAPWHTDGASVAKAYDGVGLFCISPATKGGHLHLSNAASALRDLKSRTPKFILNELFRPVPRDILENGSGQGVVAGGGDLLYLSRNPELLKLRVQHNAYPIFEHGSYGNVDRVRFRYMRQWIETGHEKGDLLLPPLLSLAMDALDTSLNAEQVASVKLAAGEMLYCNNMCIAHARDAFENHNMDVERHHVRVWIQMHGSKLDTQHTFSSTEALRTVENLVANCPPSALEVEVAAEPDEVWI